MQQVKNKGFTLIELLITVAIIGILASIAVPSYSQYLANARRLDGQVALRNAAQIMERCRTQSFTYVDCDDDAPKISPDGLYDIAFPTVTATTYTITAKPVAGKSQANDTKCTELSIIQTGATDSKPASTDSSECW